MARIRSLSRGEGVSSAHPTEVDCQWRIVRTTDGSKLLQLSTFGSDQRAAAPKVSQTIQMDAGIIRELAGIIEDEFGTHKSTT